MLNIYLSSWRCTTAKMEMEFRGEFHFVCNNTRRIYISRIQTAGMFYLLSVESFFFLFFVSPSNSLKHRKLCDIRRKMMWILYAIWYTERKRMDEEKDESKDSRQTNIWFPRRKCVLIFQRNPNEFLMSNICASLVSIFWTAVKLRLTLFTSGETEAIHYFYMNKMEPNPFGQCCILWFCSHNKISSVLWIESPLRRYADHSI